MIGAKQRSMSRGMAAIRRRLGDLGRASAKTDAAERQILEAAEDRHQAVQRAIDALRPRAVADREAAERYQELVEERGRLWKVIAAARERIR